MAMNESEIIWHNGQYVPWHEATAHVLSHALHYGSSVFEGIRAYAIDDSPSVFCLEAHVDRLFNSAKIYRMEIPYTKEEITNGILATVKANQHAACYIRPLVFRGAGGLGVNPLNSPVVTVILTLEWGRYLGPEAIEQGVQYVRNCYHSRYKAGRPIDADRGFGYEAGGGHKFSTTAEGLLSMQVCGQYEAPEVIGASNYLLKNAPRWGDEWYFYGTYYYAQGMAQRGGEYASTSRQKTALEMLKRQERDGAWRSREGHGAGAIYSTSLALLSLSVHHNNLPIYQR